MRPEIEEIFLQALDLLGKDREDYLAKACRESPGIRDELDRLLHHAEMAEDFFGEAATVMGHIAHRRGFGMERLGDFVGPYRLIERLGEGGFGVVWRASQTSPLKREVAVKVIKAGMDTREVLARFEGEREALSRMDHPGIARVLDAGESEAGRPYVVMELVRGKAVTKFCDEARLTLRDRLRLFVEICQAVSHAHQKGVIHRDLKPSNVLVTVEGRVKVIDFGIARAVEGRLTDQTLMTMAAQLMGTPAYMSPEQAAESRDLDTRTDIYALGTLLYELLVGVTPFDNKTLTSRGHDEMRRLILETDPARPSLRFEGLGGEAREDIAAARGTTSSQLRSAVAGDLDWIALKALEKDPERRYATADALAEDLLHALANEPVGARPPSRGYLVSKFIRRHRTAVLISLALVAILLTATAVSVWQAVRAKRAETRAMELLQDSKAVSSLLIDIFRLPDPEANSRNITLADALMRASQTLDRKSGLQPDRRALLQDALARSYEGLGLYPEATDLMRKALNTDETHLGPLSPATLEVQSHLGRLLYDCGYFKEAWETERSVLDRRKAAGSSDGPDQARDERILRESALRSGKAPWPASSRVASSQDRGVPDKAREDVKTMHDLIRAGLDERERRVTEMGKTRGESAPEVLAATEALARAYEGEVYREDAARVQGRLVGLLKQKYGETHHQTLEAEETLSYYLWRAGHGKEGVELRKQTIEKQRRVYGPEHPTTLEAESWLVSTLFFLGDTKATVARSREVIPVLERVLGPNDRATLNAKSFLARALLAEGGTREALGILEEIAPRMSDDTYVNLTLANLEVWFGQREQYELTRGRMLEYCIRTRDRLISRPDILERALLICSLMPYRDTTQSGEVLKTLERCEEIRKAPNAPKITEPDNAWRKYITGVVCLRTGRREQAAEAFAVVRRPDPKSGKLSPDAPLAALLEAIARSGADGKIPDRAALIEAARKSAVLPGTEQEPMLGKHSDDSAPLSRWILFREAAANQQLR